MGGGFAVVGDRIEQARLAHALALVIDDHPGRGLGTLKADVDGAIRQVGFLSEARTSAAYSKDDGRLSKERKISVSLQ